MDYVPAAEVRVIVPAAQIRVVDGDTIRLGAERIRILNIDAPETEGRAKCNAERRLAALATMTLTEIITGERLEIDRVRTASAGHWPLFVSAAVQTLGELLIPAISRSGSGAAGRIRGRVLKG
jgi:hypothetical protein